MHLKQRLRRFVFNTARLGRLLLALLCVAALPAPGFAQAAPAASEAPNPWVALTRGDLDAAYALVRDNHPGAASELGDDAFRKRLDDSYQLSLSQVGQVKDIDGYGAVLRGFAARLGDKHLSFVPLYLDQIYPTPGFIVAKRGAEWRVVDEFRSTGDQPLLGARLISCDDEDVEALAKRRLGGMRANWDLEAEQIEAAPWLLVDDNAFAPRPKACAFQTDKGRVERALKWENARWDSFLPKMGQAVKVGHPGFGLRQVGQGWWISIEQLDPRAKAVVADVEAHAAELRRAPLVVLDLRGNGGGDSQYGDAIARALYGSSAVESIYTGQSRSNCGEAWRASAANLAAIEDLSTRTGQFSGPTIAYLRKAADEMKTAMAKGQAFTRSVACKQGDAPAAPPRTAPAAGLFKGRMVVLTDHVCFSSCLLLVEEFLRLGAVQAGEGTDAGTRYMEVRAYRLPSRLARFSTLQKVALDAPYAVGPYAPAWSWNGDISDTKALEAWIATRAAGS